MKTDTPTPADTVPRYHTVGIGAGPANLSLAALFDSLAPHQLALFERQSEPGWHRGMLHAGVRMQTGWIKDLVSLLDPTHRLSILNYLVTTGRVYGMLGAGFDTIPRVEYAQYLAWAAGQLPRINYGQAIDQVTFSDVDGIISHRDGVPVAQSQNLVLGQGTVAHMPEFVADVDPARISLADTLTDSLPELSIDPDAPIAVIGSGQTSAECVAALMGAGYRSIRWMGRRTWYAPLEDSPSANDLYRPAYQDFFLGLPQQTRRRLVSSQILTSDGISPGTLRGVYQANYEQRLRTGSFPVTVMPGRDVVGARQLDDEVELRCHSTGGEETVRVRHLVIAAGRRTAPLPFSPELLDLVDLDEDGNPQIEPDYSIRWKHSDEHRIFVLNRGRYVQGLVDSNLSILPVRSAVIINALAGREVFTVRDELVSTTWA